MKYIWVKNNKCMYDDEALSYMLNKQSRLNKLIEDIKIYIEYIDKYATTKQVLIDDTDDLNDEEPSVFNQLITTLENLSIIELYTEDLLDKLREEIDDYDDWRIQWIK